MSLNRWNRGAGAGWCEGSRRSWMGRSRRNLVWVSLTSLSRPFLDTVAGKPVQGIIRGPRSSLKDPTIGPRAWRLCWIGGWAVSDRRGGHQRSGCQGIWGCRQPYCAASRGPARNRGYTACFRRMAMERVRPGTEAMSSTEASRMPCKEPKRRISIRLRLGPMPVTKSMGDRRLPLLRRLR